MTTPAPYFMPYRIGGVLYDLSHLDPVHFQVPSEKLHRAVNVRCRFSNHVFTRAFTVGLDPADAPIIMDGLRRRIFCLDRYRLSLHLPGAVLGLRDPRTYVHQTRARRNWLYVVTIELPATLTADGSVTPLRYQVFFTLRKVRKVEAAREDVEMVIESAYAEDPALSPALLGRTLFGGLVTAAVEGRTVHTQRSRRR